MELEPDPSLCLVKYKWQQLEHISLIFAAVVVCCLQVSAYRKNRRLHILSPFRTLMDNDRNRLMIILVFGSIAHTVVQLALGGLASASHGYDQLIVLPPSIWLDGIERVLIIAEYGFLNYPILACISNDVGVLSPILGCLYVVWRLVLHLLNIFHVSCPDFGQVDGLIVRLFTMLPQLICLLVIVGKFLVQIRDALRHPYSPTRKALEHSLVREDQVLYTRLLFTRKGPNLDADVRRASEGSLDSVASVRYSSRLRRVKQAFAKKWRPDFRFSTEFLSGMLIVTLFYYVLVIELLTTSALNNFVDFFMNFTGSESEKRAGEQFTRDFIYTPTVVGITTTLIVQVWLMIDLVLSHRSDLLEMYSGRKHFLMFNVPSNRELVRQNLAFPGYVVAYMIVGAAMFNATVSVLFGVVYFLVVMTIRGGVFWVVIKEVLIFLTSFLMVPVAMYIFQVVLSLLVFSEPGVSQHSIHIRNINIYHVCLFFIFFFNVLLGIGSGIFRALKSLAFSVIFIGRIDKSAIVTGYFQKFDNGFVAYASFLHVQSAYKHPVMRCFSQLLRDAVLQKGKRSRPRLSQFAFNRWFLALTLTNNPSLIRLRKRDKRKESLDVDDVDLISLSEFERSPLILNLGDEGIEVLPATVDSNSI